ncbi:ribonuclease H-like domain-containing protein [Tanacetum coccineum]
MNVAAYKAGLESVEARLVVYQKNETVYEEDIKILKFDIILRDNALIERRKKLEKAEKERDDLKLTLEKFQNSSKNLSKLLDSQVSDNHKSGVGYDSQVSDENQSDAENISQMNDKNKTESVFSESATSVPAVVTSKVETSKAKPESVRKYCGAPIIEDWESDCDEEDVSKTVKQENVSKTVKPNYAKIEFVGPKPTRKPVKQIRQDTNSPSNKTRGNQRNWNNMVSQRLGNDYEMLNKACFVCGSFNHLIKDCDFYEKKMVQKHVWNNAMTVNHKNLARMTHPHPKRNFVPTAVLTRPRVNGARPMSNTFNKAHSSVGRPFNKLTAKKNSNFNNRVNTVKGSKVNTARTAVNSARPREAVNAARPRTTVNTARPKAVLKAVRGNLVNVVKASACWGNPEQDLQERGIFDSGCSRHMTGNKSYLTDFEEIDGGFVAFGGNSMGGKIIRKDFKLADENHEWGDSVEMAATTATSLDAEQDSADWNGIEVSTAAASSCKDLLLLLQVNAARHNLMLLGYYCWSTGEVKKFNGNAQIHALIDGKKIVVSKATIRSVLHLADEGGVDCLPTTTIFEEIAKIRYEKPSQKLTFYKAFFNPQWKFMIHTILQCLSAKTTAWNEFSSIVASAIICLATNQKFNFSKYILEGMLRNLDHKAVKFLMYPRFVWLIVNQVEGFPRHTRKYAVPCHTKKIFGNMKRVNKDFSGNITPLFLTMVVQTQTPPPTITSTHITPTPTTSTPIPTPNQPTPSVHPSQPQKQRVRKLTRRDTKVTQPSEPEMVVDEDVLIERVATQSNDTLNGKDRLKLNELINLCTNLQSKVLELEKTKSSQQIRIESLERKVKKLEKSKKTRTHKLKRLYKVGLSRRVISSDDEAVGRNEDMMFDVEDLVGDELVVETEAASEDVNLNEDEVTLAQTLQKMKSTTPRAIGVVIREREQDDTQRTMISQKKSRDKGKAKMTEPEQPVKLSRKEQISFDEQEAKRLQAQFDEETRVADEEAQRIEEANKALTNEWDDIQAKVDVDYQMAQRLQQEEQEKLTDTEKAKLFVQLLEARKKHFAAKRAEKQRSKPPTQAQQRELMSTYLKNIDGWKLNQLKNKSFENIQKLFNIAMKRVNSFVDMDTEVVEGSSKRAGSELRSESAKKQKADDDKETTELQMLVIISPDKKEVVVDAIPLAKKIRPVITKSQGLMGVSSYIKCLVSCLKDLIEKTCKLYGVMFEPHVEDAVWRELREGKVLLKLLLLKLKLKVNIVKVRVSAAKLNLVLLSNVDEKYAK